MRLAPSLAPLASLLSYASLASLAALGALPACTDDPIADFDLVLEQQRDALRSGGGGELLDCGGFVVGTTPDPEREANQCFTRAWSQCAAAELERVVIDAAGDEIFENLFVVPRDPHDGSSVCHIVRYVDSERILEKSRCATLESHDDAGVFELGGCRDDGYWFPRPD